MKTDDQIEKDKEAVAKMIGAKGAMEAMIRRHEQLETSLKTIASISTDLGRAVGEDLYIKTFHHGKREGGCQLVSIKSQLQRISEIVGRVT